MGQKILINTFKWGSILLLFFYFQFFPPERAYAPEAASSPFYEVIAIPAGKKPDQLKSDLKHYIQKRHYPGGRIPIIFAVPQTAGLPLYEPLPFYQPSAVRYIARSGDSITFFDPSCACGQELEIDNAKRMISLQRTRLEEALVVRSGLYHYYVTKGHLPAKLAELLRPFPGNYLSQLPSGKGNLLQQKNLLQESVQLKQGFEYRSGLFNPSNPWFSLQKAVRLYQLEEPNEQLEPIEIKIYEPSYRLLVMSGRNIVRSYPIGLGAENRTPTGVYQIVLKVNQPLSVSKVYGTRGLVLSDERYAIHGTNDPASIGKAVSKGCIRLDNQDVEELYSLIPLGTKVTISKEKAPSYTSTNPSPRFILPVRPDEQNPLRVYHWNN
ncbi:L,D-transpeptidase [Aneurinibacillus sp. Ricciae_BoGa-3]|uniref:L,D-transpeptidase n=1 Tax=Aneurinibacillus sp. Ricciae_BoGa-3 TaxID=3022697 RepID=UPI002340460A|nr:L,D-transpeptidase [Aneurinibacillus sp. Ricciae_BoGa-3]WCK55716.1 L,D-transpeptidase [Aneurinibacillus sp. Ricciae_BoGa-3]